MVHDGYFDGLVDGDGNATAYGTWMMQQKPPWAERTGDGMKLINGGAPRKGSANNPNGTIMNPNNTSPLEGSVVGQGPGSGDPTVSNSTAGTTAGGTPQEADTTWSVDGLNIGNDGTAYITIKHWDQASSDYKYSTIELGNPNNPNYDWGMVAKNTGIATAVLQAAYEKAYVEWQQTEAGKKALSTWHYDSMNPKDGSITVKNGAGNTESIGYDKITDPAWLAAHPGVDLSQVQKAIQDVNRQNWMDTYMTQPGTAAYQASKYYIMGGVAQGTKPPPDTPNNMPGPGQGATVPGQGPPGATPAIPGPGGVNLVPAGRPAGVPITTTPPAPAPTGRPAPGVTIADPGTVNQAPGGRGSTVVGPNAYLSNNPAINPALTSTTTTNNTSSTTTTPPATTTSTTTSSGYTPGMYNPSPRPAAAAPAPGTPAPAPAPAYRPGQYQIPTVNSQVQNLPVVR